MLLRDDDRATTTLEGGVVVKRFKPGHILHPGVYTDHWLSMVNGFAEATGHFPKVIDLNQSLLVTEWVEGSTLRKQRDAIQSASLEDQRQFHLEVQRQYYRFVSNLLNYNHIKSHYMCHGDLNLSNMILTDRIVCIDIDAVRIDHHWVENNWITIPQPWWQQDADELNTRKRVDG